MSGPSRKPIVGRSIGRREGTLAFGKYPISAKMGPRYLAACRTTASIIQHGQAAEDELAQLSEMKGMYNRVLRQDRADWEAVRHLLGEPDRAICNLAARWLDKLRTLAKSGEPIADHLNAAIARGVKAAALRAQDALERAGFS